MVSPKYVILSGGASVMNFVEELVRRYFPNATIVSRYKKSERMISDGAAKYINKRYHDDLMLRLEDRNW